MISALRNRLFPGLLAAPLAGLLLAGSASAADPAPAPAAPAAPAAPLTVKDALKRLAAANPESDEDRAALRVDPDSRKAWQTVVDAGKDALPELRAALKALKPVGGDDDFFRITAGGLLWRIGGTDTVAEAAAIWNDPGLDLSKSPVLVHSIAYQAARTRDPKVLPLLFASFRETDGTVDLPRGNLTLQWPETSEYAWAAFGPAGRAELLKLLETSKDDGQLATAAWLLSRDGQAAALPALRKLAKTPGEQYDHARQTAITALGLLGHPDDFDFLIQGFADAIKGDDISPDADAYVDALVEYGDMRAVQPLLAYVVMLKTEVEYDHPEDGELDRMKIREALMGMLDPMGLALLRAEIANLTGPERADADALLATFFAALATPADEYDKLDMARQIQKLAEYRRFAESDFALDNDAKKQPREVFTATVDRIRREGRLPFDQIVIDEVETMLPAHLLSACTPADIDHLLEARTVLARRLSGEALNELDMISAMVVRLARSEYRKQVGVCEKVEKK